MSVQTISVIARPEEAGPIPGREVVERLLSSWMPARFLPVSVSGLWGGQTLPNQPPESGRLWEGAPLWEGENEGGGALTEFGNPNSEFADRLTARLPDGEFGCIFRGALRHRPTLESHPSGWYGRAKIPAGVRQPAQLWELAQVSVEWSRIDHRVAVQLPLAGYPITLAVPPVNSESAVPMTSLPGTVEENRREIFAWIAELPARLGWSGPIEWEISAERALFDEDAAALEEWERRLQQGDL